MVRKQTMSGGTRSKQHGAILLGIAGGMLVVAGGLAGTYYTIATRSEAHAATRSGVAPSEPRGDGKVSTALAAIPGKSVELKTSVGSTSVTWADLGVEIDPGEVARAGTPQTDAELGTLANQGSLPVRVDFPKATAKLVDLKAKLDRAAIDAYLDLETRVSHPDAPGRGLDVWGSLPRLEAAARQGATTLDLAEVAIPASVTKASLGIDDISQVLGHYTTHFPPSDHDRNFNLKLAASKLNGHVLAPGVEFSFNATVGERSELAGYKVAHVITAGEMVDGLAGGTCQISTTLFGASFFAGLDIVKTTNHSRPSAYTPLGFDATVVWPNTDLKLKNPYEFPVVIHYRVANGEAVVEVLGKARPYEKITFDRTILQEDPFTSEERLDENMPDGQTSLDQQGLDGFQIVRARRFYKDGKQVKEEKWSVTYAPVTEYVRRGTNKDPDAKAPAAKDVHEWHPEQTSSHLEQ